MEPEMKTAALALLLWVAAPASLAQDPRLDVLIHGGQLIDGTGSEARRADVGIAGDRIVFVGDAGKRGLYATRILAADGLIVAPGFIDPHTHSDQQLQNPKLSHNQPYLYQGITTVFAGNDGTSPWPLSKAIEGWQRHGIGTNVALFVGQGTVRAAVMAMSDADPTAEQLERMRAMVRQGMREGAFGMSTGLFYAPGNFTKTEEIIELAKIVAQHGGIYDTHMRSESSAGIGLLAAIQETIRIGREAKLPVHISHIKTLGADVWGQSKRVIEIIRAARAEGVAVTANQYPYIASATVLHAALIPPWAQVGGHGELVRRMDDPQQRPKLVADIGHLLTVRGGPDAILFRRADTVPPELAGRTLADVARESGKPPVDAALDAIRKASVLPIISFNMNEDDVEAYMREEWVMTGSDGTFGHPRTFGTFPRKIREYVLKRKVLTLPAAIRSSSALTAQTFGLAERGTIREGNFADIVVFDEAAIADRATYLEPSLLSAGVRYVIVNGRIAIDDGEYNGALAGRMLRKVSETRR
jgi:N-acyl-D-amino-acid deacylase